jgi:hypothetical protein
MPLLLWQSCRHLPLFSWVLCPLFALAVAGTGDETETNNKQTKGDTVMKSFIAMVVALGLGAANVAEAHGGHGGHGHAGHGHAGHHGHVAHHTVNRHRGIVRTTWATKTWNATHRRYFYTDPAVSGTYYWSEIDKLYYPIDLLPALPTGTIIVTPR